MLARCLGVLARSLGHVPACFSMLCFTKGRQRSRALALLGPLLRCKLNLSAHLLFLLSCRRRPAAAGDGR